MDSLIIKERMKLLLKALFTMVILMGVSSAAQQKPTTLLIWGDSLSAAYGMPVEKGWVQLLQNKHPTLNIINASISGETTQGGLSRLPAALKTHTPDIVLIELGANDGLRGLPIKTMQNNLTQMIAMIQASKAKVVIAGMKIPPNYGLKYAQQFETSLQDLAKTYNAAFIPFLLENIISNDALMQDDNLHPTAAAQPIILKHVDTVIEMLLDTKH
jgi:acyl-CoA thioesterase-1